MSETTTVPTLEPMTAAAFARALQAKKLLGSRCTGCGAVHLPPRQICTHCRSEAQEWMELSGRGRLAAFTSIFIAPTAMVAAGHDRNNPYVSGLVQLEEGPLFSARILGVDARQPDLEWIGRAVNATWIETGDAGAPTVALAFTAA